MNLMKIAAITVVAYVGIIVAFESLIGILQPESGLILVITTVDEDGGSHDRVVSRLVTDEKLYVAANHWPRAWYKRALANPEVNLEVDIEGKSGPYRAVPIAGAEHARVDSENSLPFVFRVLTGFPPRVFLRLDPQ